MGGVLTWAALSEEVLTDGESFWSGFSSDKIRLKLSLVGETDNNKHSNLKVSHYSNK